LDSSVATQFGIIIILILLSAFFASAKTAFTSINNIRIQELADENNKYARLVLQIVTHSDKMLRTILIGNTIVNLSAAALTTLISINLWNSKMIALAIGILMLLLLIFGEIIPKMAAAAYADKLALSYCVIILFFMRILTPVIFIIHQLSRFFLQLLRINPDANLNTVTEHQIRTMVDESHKDGVIEPEERQMIHNVFDFGDTQAKDIMVPRVDVVFIDINSTYHEVAKLFKRDKFTRLPVYEDSIDNVIGVINMKDLLFHHSSKNFSIQRLMRKPHFTYEYKNISELMNEMRENAINFTIVLDEYGATAGLITLEDLLEELVGEIRDEYDKDEEKLIQKISEYEYIIEGSFKLDDLNDALNLNLISEEYDSIGGYAIELLDGLPESGESAIDKNGIRIVVDCITNNHIDKVHLYLPSLSRASEEIALAPEKVPQQ